MPLVETLALLGDERREPGVRGVAGQYPVGYERVDAQSVQRDPGAGGAQGLGRRGPRLGDQPQGRRGVLDERLDGGQLGVPPGGRLVQPLRGHGYPGELGHHRAQRAGGLPLLGQQSAQIAAQVPGQGEQGQGVAQRRQVDDEDVPVPGRGPAQGVQQGGLFAARQFGEFLTGQLAGAEEFERRGGPLLEGERLRTEVRAGVDARGPQAVPYRSGVLRRPGGRAEDIAERVGGEQQDTSAAAGGGERGGGGDGRTARPARAGDEDRTHRRQAPGTDSTRFLRPARARSMMTFSALRLIMPSIGILTSTVSR